jgi:hypothetical protein
VEVGGLTAYLPQRAILAAHLTFEFLAAFFAFSTGFAFRWLGSWFFAVKGSEPIWI